MPIHEIPVRVRTQYRRTRLAAAATAGLLALAAALGAVSPAAAAVGDTYKYFGSSSSGAGIRIVGSTSTYATKQYALQGQGSAASSSSYSVDFTGTPPTSNHNYTQADWSGLPQASAVAGRGAVEWILKNGFPASSTAVLRDRLRAIPQFATFPTGTFSESEAIAAQQAAIWHITDGVDLDLTATSANSARTRLFYQYLVQESAGKDASTGAAPTVSLAAENGRTAFSVEADAAFGPFTLTSSAPATLSTSGGANIVGSTGQALTGAQQPGTVFWVQPTAAPAADGATTVRAQTAAISTTVVNAALGKQNVSPFAARENLAVLSTSSQSANTELPVTWQIDRNAPGQFDANGAATTRSYTYMPRGELSATLEKLTFTDGTSTTTDLIGLTGNGSDRSADVYSARFAGTAINAAQGPVLASGSAFTEGDWNAAPHLADNAAQGSVARILQQSYPTRTTSQLTAAVQSAGLLAPGSATIKNWEAIAATQAAIWHATDGKELDTTRYATPNAATAADGASAAAVLDGDATTAWQAPAPGQAAIDFTFPANFEPRSYAVTTRDGAAAGATPTSWKLQRSTDGMTFSDVSTSSVTHAFAGGSSETRVSGNIPSGATYGSATTRYRIVFSGAADPTQAVEIAGVSFEGFGVFGAQPNYEYRQYANAANVVQVYRYLLADADANPVAAPAPSATVTAATDVFVRESASDLIGPFTVDGSSALSVSFADATDATLLTDPTAEPVSELVVAPRSEFWVRAGDADAGDAVLTARTSAVNWTTARALTTPNADGPVLVQLGVASITGSATYAFSYAVAPPAELTTSVDRAAIGGAVGVSGSGYRSGEAVALTLEADGIEVLQAVADESGAFAATITVPAAASIGQDRLFGVGADSSRSASAPLEVAAAIEVDGPGDPVDPVGPGDPEPAGPGDPAEPVRSVDPDTTGQPSTPSVPATAVDLAAGAAGAAASAPGLSVTGASANGLWGLGASAILLTIVAGGVWWIGVRHTREARKLVE